MYYSVNFGSLMVFLGWVESLIQAQLKSHLFPTGILAKSISMTHSGMSYQLDISKFFFKIYCTVSDFCLFIPSSHADNHSYDNNFNIFISFKYTIYALRLFTAFIFHRFSVDYVKVIELRVNANDVTCNLSSGHRCNDI